MASDKCVLMRPVVIDDDSKNVTIGGGACVLTTGTYPNIASVAYELQVKGLAVPVAGFAVTLNSDLKINLAASGVFAVTWTDTNLRNMLGFTGNLASAASYTATYTPQYTWFPARVRADNDEWYLDNKSQWKGSESRSGNVCGLRTGTSIYRTTLQYEALPDYECIRARALTTYQDVRSLEYFAAQSREVWGAIDAPSPSGFFFFPDYTAVTIQASASYTSGDATTFHRTSGAGTFVFCSFDADWYPKFKPTIRAAQSEWYDIDVDVHTATAPTWTGA